MFGLTILSKIKNYIWSRITSFLVLTGIIAVVGISSLSGGEEVKQVSVGVKPELATVQRWQADKPKTDEEWKLDVKEEQLNVKHDYQLDQMQESLTTKLPKVQADLNKFIECPECIKWDLNLRFTQMFKDQNLDPKKDKLEDKTLQEWVDGEYQSEHEYYQWKTGKIEQSLERITKEKELRASKKVDRTDEIIGTVYYIDSGDCTNYLDGTWTWQAGKATMTATLGDATATQIKAGSHVKPSGGNQRNQWYTVGWNPTTSNIITLTATYKGSINQTDVIDTTCRNIGTGLNTTTTKINNASSTNGPFAVLDQFTEVARSPGDRVVVRRGRSNLGLVDDNTALAFTSDGTWGYPIIIEADYDNVWASFTNSVGTAELGWGTDSITMSATTGIATGTWIYNTTDGDNPREYAYEVKDWSYSDGLRLYLPFKGTPGSGKTLKIMYENPVFGSTSGKSNLGWNFDTDFFWKVQGINNFGYSSNGNIEIDSCSGHFFKDMVFDSSATSTSYYTITLQDDYSRVILEKIIAARQSNIIWANYADIYSDISIKDSVLKVESGGNVLTVGTTFAGYVNGYFKNNIIGIQEKENEQGLFSVGGGLGVVKFVLDGNIDYVSTSQWISSLGQYQGMWGESIEQDRNVINNNMSHNNWLSPYNRVLASTSIYMATSGTTHLGSSIPSLQFKNSRLFAPYSFVSASSSGWELSALKLFEYPIYADTSVKNYSMYFRPIGTTDFLNNPTAQELWIECEYYGTTSNVLRRLTKSTGTINASSTAWQAITVACQPAQNGVLYLRGWYAKTLEPTVVSFASNTLLMDVQPVITTP